MNAAENSVVAFKGGNALALSEGELVKVLQSSLYPGAALESIKLVLGYCKAAGYDPMQKPCHIVPMWDSKAGAMRDVIMPGVGLYRTQAARTGQFAGMTEPEFGPDVTEELGGARVTYPQWCRVTVKRQMSSGAVAEFTAREFWKENYAVRGGKEKSIAPNAMWAKRVYGQLAKCAQAQALRLAFPEATGADATADEMEGKELHMETMLEASDLQMNWVAAANDAINANVLAEVWKTGVKVIKEANDVPAYNAFKATVEARGVAFKKAVAESVVATVEKTEVDPFVADMERAEAQQ